MTTNEPPRPPHDGAPQVPPAAGDDAWLDALRGRARAGTDEATRRAAADLRAALLDAQRRREGEVVREDPLELQRLLFRLRREGLLGAAAPAGGGAANDSTWRRRAPLALAAALALGIALTMVVPGGFFGGEEDTLRSGAGQSIQVDDVAATAQRIEAALRASGAAVSVVELGDGAREIAATVPPERLAETRRALQPFGVRVPDNGALRIEVGARR